MTRIVLITDTHLDPTGAEPEGYHQQPRYAARLPELLAAFDAWLQAQATSAGAGPVDLIAHLGDTPQAEGARSAVPLDGAGPVDLVVHLGDTPQAEGARSAVLRGGVGPVDLVVHLGDTPQAEGARSAVSPGGVGPVDLVVHLGDIVDRAAPEAVQAAARAFALSVPVRLVLGNHDMATPADSDERADALWLREAPALFDGDSVTTTLDFPDCVVHLVPTQWERGRPFYWGEVQVPHYLPEQVAALEAALAARPDVPHILCTHGEVLGVPPDQTGFDTLLHAPPDAYTETVLGWVGRYPHLRAVFSGHNHINTHHARDGAHVVTASAFVETPFEFKVVDVAPGRLSMVTIPLLPALDFRAAYDWDKIFVQGRLRDRSFTEGE